MDTNKPPVVILSSADFHQPNGYTNAAYQGYNDPYPTKDDSIWTELNLNHEPKYETADDATITLTRSTSLVGTLEDNSVRPWYKCGRPKWASIQMFTFIICILQGVNGLLVTGYTVSVLTTIEKQFRIDSTISGFVISSYEIGSILSVVFVSYFGTQGHIPRWIGLGGMLLAIGSFLFALPQVLAHYIPKNCTTTVEDQICKLTDSSLFPIISKSFAFGDVSSSESSDCNPDSDDGGSNYVYILIIAQILLGIGGSPLLTLGTVYIDNNAEKSNSALYIGKTFHKS